MGPRTDTIHAVEALGTVVSYDRSRKEKGRFSLRAFEELGFEGVDRVTMPPTGKGMLLERARRLFWIELPRSGER